LRCYQFANELPKGEYLIKSKGLSFREISSVRNTKEKTVRQEGSIIYSKANVEGRYEFAAWFLADFM